MTLLAQALAQTIDDCWNRIGVAGDQSCPTLPAVVHCRNCPVYAEAAQRNLQRPVDDAYRAEWAAHFARPAVTGAGADHAALVFRVQREWLALPAASVDAVAPLAPSHKLPHRSHPALLGIVSVAGKLTPLISLEAILGIDGSAGAADAREGRHIFPRLLVLQADGQRYAMRVAELHGIARYGAQDLGTPPATVNKGLARFVTGVLSLDALKVGVLDAPLLAHQLAGCLR
jgi:chemotaxis-related protein WspD